MIKKRDTGNRGFTLVELIVATALFAVVMMVSVSTLLALVNANRKAQAIQSVMNNLNVALDGMVRSAREGAGYSCTNTFSGNDCPGGSQMFSFAPLGDVAAQRWVYIFVPATPTTPGMLKKSIMGSSDPALATAITAPEVTIDDLKFYVVGTAIGDFAQPKVVIVVKGSAGVPGTSARTTFHIQATAVQRALDI